MIAKTIVESDAFLDMPASTRLLYYDLNMRADDDGFINAPKKILRETGASTDDLGLLILKKFIIPFDSGIVVIKHWRIHNYIRKDTYTETKYKDEKGTLTFDLNNAYTTEISTLIEPVDEPSTQVREGKGRLGKVRLGERGELAPYGVRKNVLLSEDEYAEIVTKYEAPKSRIDKISLYLANAPREYEDHYALIEKIASEDLWARKKVEEEIPAPINPISDEERESLMEQCKNVLGGTI